MSPTASTSRAGLPWEGQPYSIKRFGVTITNCDSEPVHTPGCVQAHGALLVVRPADLTVLQASENIEAILGCAPEALLGRSLGAAIAEEAEARLRAFLATEPIELQLAEDREQLAYCVRLEAVHNQLVTQSAQEGGLAGGPSGPPPARQSSIRWPTGAAPGRSGAAGAAITAASARTASPLEPVSSSPSHRRVLVVDDNVDGAETLAMLLELSGHEATTAGSGPAALEVARAWHPELVFLDIGLPGMDGRAVHAEMAALMSCARSGVTPVGGTLYCTTFPATTAPSTSSPRGSTRSSTSSRTPRARPRISTPMRSRCPTRTTRLRTVRGSCSGRSKALQWPEWKRTLSPWDWPDGDEGPGSTGEGHR